MQILNANNTSCLTSFRHPITLARKNGARHNPYPNPHHPPFNESTKKRAYHGAKQHVPIVRVWPDSSAAAAQARLKRENAKSASLSLRRAALISVRERATLHSGESLFIRARAETKREREKSERVVERWGNDGAAAGAVFARVYAPPRRQRQSFPCGTPPRTMSRHFDRVIEVNRRARDLPEGPRARAEEGAGKASGCARERQAQTNSRSARDFAEFLRCSPRNLILVMNSRSRSAIYQGTKGAFPRAFFSFPIRYFNHGEGVVRCV